MLSAAKAFHGRTSLAVEATDNAKIIAPINANGHVTYLPLNDLAAWEAELSKGDVCACIIECIQGVGGIKLATEEFAQGLQEACKRHGAVLVCDEIQCGYGRSGRFFAHQWLGIRPDLITVAKGIGNGFPMGAVLISPDFKPEYGQPGHHVRRQPHGLHGRAGRARRDGERKFCWTTRARLATISWRGWKELQAEEKHIADVRGRGLMIGIDLDMPHKEPAQPPHLRRALLHGLRLDQHPAPAAAAYVHQGDGRRLHPAAQASVRGCQVTMVRMFAHA